MERVNRVSKTHKHLRQASKTISFALQYQGTWLTLVNNSGLEENQAKEIEARYHELYQVSTNWTKAKIKQASIDGYVTLAFGLKLRTPVLQKSVIGSIKNTQLAEAEARTAGNAVSGQSYCQLTTRALVGVMKRVWASQWRTEILPCMTIHDALYFIIKDDLECLEWFNKVLIEEMSWQDLPELADPDIHLTAELEVYKNWAKPIAIPNNATYEELEKIFETNNS